MPLKARVSLYNALILPLFDYGDVIWGDKNNDTIMSELQILQNKAAKVMLGQPPRSSSTEALKSLNLKSLSTRRFFHRCIAIHKCLIGETDFNFNFTKTQVVHSYNTRRSNDIILYYIIIIIYKYYYYYYYYYCYKPHFDMSKAEYIIR